jgi:HD-like signal output (HDOD) protein
MKSWINRLLSGSNEDVPATGPSAVPETASDAAAQAEDPPGDIEAAYYRWLTSSVRYSAPAEAENLILDEIRNQSLSVAAVAGLVPRVPEVIPQLLASLSDDGVSIAELSRQVAQDLVLSAEVIREANNAYYRPMTPVKTIEAAIMMLGQNGLRMLLARLAFRPMIKLQPDGVAGRLAPRIWNQSEKCALAASLLAPGLTAGIFEAYLAGLMQNLGLVVALRIADRVGGNGKLPGSSEFGASLLACSRQLSAAIAAYWDFPQAVAEAIAQAGDPGQSHLAQALAQGDHIAKLHLLVDAGVLAEDDASVTEGLDSFQRRCLGKLSSLDD